MSPTKELGLGGESGIGGHRFPSRVKHYLGRILVCRALKGVMFVGRGGGAVGGLGGGEGTWAAGNGASPLAVR